VYCRGRAQGAGCNCKATFLEIYEAQIEWYLENFVIPQDYQGKILEAHRKLEAAYDEVEKRRNQLERRLERIKELYKWDHIGKQEYLVEYANIQKELGALTAREDKGKMLDKLAHFLSNVADAWKEASQEQRNKLANTLFEEVWIEHNRVTGVKPKEELRPLFQLSYEQHLKSITRQPESLRGRTCYFFINIFPVFGPVYLTAVPSGRCKLPASLCPELAEQHKTHSLRQLAEEYSVSHETIRRILVTRQSVVL